MALPRRVSSPMAMTLAREVSFTSETLWLARGGSTRRTAWGSTTRR